MNSTDLDRHHLISTDRPGAEPLRHRWMASAAVLLSAATGALAALWLARPGWNPHATDIASPLGQEVSAEIAALVQLVIGLAGLGAAVAALVATAHRGAPWPAWLAPAGALLGAITGLGLLGMGVIAGLGYLVALVVPVGLLVLVVGLLRLGGRARWATVAVLALAAAVGVGSGVLTPEAWGLTEMLGQLVTEAPRQLAAPFVLTANALVWTVLGTHAATAHGRLDRAAAWVLRHRTAITVVAALGPLPYALQRLTWLTPWPILAPDDITPAIRLWGITLSLGAWAGFVLTLGLIQRWGEVFPRWMPRFAGRAVPVWFAALPGTVVAASLIVSAGPMLAAFWAKGTVEGLVGAVVFPFWLWGPALGLAVCGYVLHRRQSLTDRRP